MSDKRVNRNSPSSPYPNNSKISDPCSQSVTEYEVKTTFPILAFSSAWKAVLFPPHFKPTSAIPDVASFTSAIFSVVSVGCSSEEMCYDTRIYFSCYCADGKLAAHPVLIRCGSVASGPFLKYCHKEYFC